MSQSNATPGDAVSNVGSIDDGIVDPSIIEWIREVTHAAEVRIERRGGGASRAGYAVDVQHGDGRVDARWLRIDTGHGPQSTTTYTVRREGAVYRALKASAVRVAELIAIHPTRQAFLAERLVGHNWFAEIRDVEEQTSTARAFMGQLAALHAIDPATLDLPELGERRTISEHVRDELALWTEQYLDGGDDDPTIALSLAWLRANVPDDGDWPLVLVQGDTGPGNFMYANGDVVAVMDWEMAHWGDIHDDLGWICVRDVQERFGSLPERFAEYTAAGGRAVDLDRLRYFRVFAQMRCAVGTRRGLLAHDSRGEIANHLIYATLHIQLLVDALASAMGVAIDARSITSAMDDDGLSPAGSVNTWLYDVALDDLRDVVVPAVPNGFARNRAKGLARLLKYLRRAELLGPRVDEAERSELGALLGHAVHDVRAAQRTLCARISTGDIDHAVVLGYCARWVARRVDVARDAMGALATRQYAPID